MKVIIGIAVVSLLVFGLSACVQLESPKEEKKSSAELIAGALSKRGILVEEILITNGSEAAKAFNVKDIEIPQESKIALIMFRISDSKSADEKLGEYVKAVYITFDADPALDGVMAFDVNLAEASGTALIIYTDKTGAERVRNRNLTPEEILNEWGLIEYTPESERLIREALEKENIKINTVLISNGTYIKEQLKLNDSEIGEDSKIALITFNLRKNVTESEFLRYYVDIIYTAFEADPSINVAMASNIELTLASGKASIIYANRTTVRRVPRWKTAEEIMNEFKLHEYSVK
ncbi:MAG: hypothetical protein ABH874_03295 [Methanobacteriota archaeon]